MKVTTASGSDQVLAKSPGDRIEELSTRDRWSVDARRVVGIPGGVIQGTAEATRANEAIRVLRVKEILESDELLSEANESPDPSPTR